MKRHSLPYIATSIIALFTHIQSAAQVASANDYLTANKRTDVTMFFNTNDKGVDTPVLWGLDTAWPDEWNIVRGTNFIGREQLGTGRVSFQPSDLIVNGELSEDQKKDLDERLKLMSKTGVKNIALNSDHEVLCAYGEDDTEEWKAEAAEHRKNYVGKPEEWIKLFKATVNYCRDKGFNVVSIAPFNEADFKEWNQGTMEDFKNICKLMKEDEFFEGIRVSGGNTLNSDKALEWYDGLKKYLDEGNTHWLAGSFDNYANFFTTVRSNGHYATADELHNVVEAMVGVEYGMQSGIWWGFDGRARGEYCKATFGKRLAYAEDRPHWTAASVYRMPDERVQAFFGTSERDALNSSYRIVSQDKVAYFDGYGPMHEYIVDLPGGTKYGEGQTNAERVLEIHTGEDVPLAPTEGKFIIMNKKSRKILMPNGSAASKGAALCQGQNKKKEYQHWNITPVDSRTGGDFSYFHISNVGATTTLNLNVKDGSLSSGGSIILYNAENNLEQWYFQYAGDGYYYIVSRHSGLCLEIPKEGDNVTQSTIDGTDQQLWRLLPIDAACEKTAPGVPTGLKANPTGSVIKLSWNANTDSDIAGYCVLRASATDEEWNTIARNVVDTTFIDNTVSAGQGYMYKIRAIDKSFNRSDPSDVVQTSTTSRKEAVLSYQFESNLEDNTSHMMHSAHYGNANYSKGKIGEKALQLNGTSNYLQLPTAVAHREEMTIAMWIKWGNSGSNWQRIFDFGNNEDQYIFLTANGNNNIMCLAAKNGGAEQSMNIATRLTSTWRHVTITIGKDRVVAYVDGQEKAASDQITIRPSDFNPIFNYVGRSQFASDPMFKGDIDDLRIYNYALSANEVEDLFAGKKLEADIEAETEATIENTHSEATVVNTLYYTLDGACHTVHQKGINIVRTRYSDGSMTVEKVLVQ